MSFAAELSTSPDDDGRRAARAEVVLGAGLRQRGAHAVTVQVLDLSITGFRAATHLELMNGTDICSAASSSARSTRPCST